MSGRSEIAMLRLVPVLMISTAPIVGAQRPTPPPMPSGNRIVVQDGDLVVVESDARVGIVRRREAQVRTVFSAAERWLVVLADYTTSAGPADGRVDFAYYYRHVGGEWPFEARWEGAATIEEYSMVAPGGRGGLGITTPQGLVQIGPQQEFRDPNAVAVLSSGSGGSGGANELGFDEAERWFVTQVRRNDGVMQSPAGGAAYSSMGLRAGVDASNPSAVRVGGNVRPPKKIFDVRPVFPDEAVRAGIRGIVVLEITIDVDGTVKDARVLRSIPMLDAAALEAVRRWRYEPTTIDGRAMPVVMTVSVAFE